VAEAMRDVMLTTRKGYTIKKVSDTMIRKELTEFENAFPDGVYAGPRNPKKPVIKVRALLDYCKRYGVKPDDISDREMEQFLVPFDKIPWK
jgi:hypothetical protein